MTDWTIRTTEHTRLIDNAVDQNGDNITRGAVVKYNSREGEVCFIWRHSTQIDALVIRTGNAESIHYCKQSCPERMEGTCLGGYPVATTSVLLIAPSGCPECQACVSTCKEEEPCDLHEEKVK